MQTRGRDELFTEKRKVYIKLIVEFMRANFKINKATGPDGFLCCNDHDGIFITRKRTWALPSAAARRAASEVRKY